MINHSSRGVREPIPSVTSVGVVVLPGGPERRRGAGTALREEGYVADEVQQQEDDQNLWRAVYTAHGGWSEGTAFADHLSVAAPALAEVSGTLYCAHRGARQEQRKQLPLRWTSFTPAALVPLVAALEQARVPLPEGASDEEKLEQQERITAAAEALDKARRWAPDADVDWLESAETPALVNDNGTVRMVFTHVGWMHDSRSPYRGPQYGVPQYGGPQYGDQPVRSTSLWETQLDGTEGRPEDPGARGAASGAGSGRVQRGRAPGLRRPAQQVRPAPGPRHRGQVEPGRHARGPLRLRCGPYRRLDIERPNTLRQAPQSPSAVPR